MYSYRSDLGFWIMKNRYKNPHLEIHTSGIYCLPGNRVGILPADLVLTSVLSPPPPPNVTVKYNNTLQQNNFQSFGSSNTTIPTHPFWIVVGFCCYVRFFGDTCESWCSQKSIRIKSG